MDHENHASGAVAGLGFQTTIKPCEGASHLLEGFPMNVLRLSPTLNRFLNNEEGVTAIEYGLMAALIVVVIVGALRAVGDANSGIYAIWTSAVIAAL
jgi:pilus assembly protein Flp/PilA